MRIYVPLPEAAHQRLVDLARAERRHPSDQASLLLERVLREARVVEGEALSIDSSPRMVA